MNLACFPAHLPTPLDRLDRLTTKLCGLEIRIKRDDLPGLRGRATSRPKVASSSSIQAARRRCSAMAGHLRAR